MKTGSWWLRRIAFTCNSRVRPAMLIIEGVPAEFTFIFYGVILISLTLCLVQVYLLLSPLDRIKLKLLLPHFKIGPKP
uniref:Uncharacterized protein n=1 Tax=Strigamia maritima TaxID=126957 RepID=T1IQI3_STRMM